MPMDVNTGPVAAINYRQMSYQESKSRRTIVAIGVTFWNFLLFSVGVLLGFYLTYANFYAAIVLYFLIAAISFVWSNRILFTLLPAAIAFPLTLTTLAWSMYLADTDGKGDESFWSFWALKDQENVDFFFLSLIAVAVGWLLTYLIFRRREEWIRKARPYFFVLSAIFISSWIVLALLDR